MRPTSVGVLSLALVAIFISYCSAYNIPDSSLDVSSNAIELTREKRQVETFDTDDYPSAANEDAQDEPGFWDRVVRIAVKLFSRFVEWLNS